MDESANARRTLQPALRVGRVLAEGERPRFFGYAADVSESGMFVQSMRPRAVGERVRLVLFAKSAPGGALCLDTEVRWLRGYTGPQAEAAGMGLEFVNLGKIERLYLRDFCADPSGNIATGYRLPR